MIILCTEPRCTCKIRRTGLGLAVPVIVGTVLIARSASAITHVATDILKIILIGAGGIAISAVITVACVIAVRRRHRSDVRSIAAADWAKSNRTAKQSRGILYRLTVIYLADSDGSEPSRKALPASPVLQVRALPPGRSAEPWQGSADATALPVRSGESHAESHAYRTEQR